MGFIEDDKFAETLLALYDLTLLYGVLFARDRPTLMTLRLFDHARYLVGAATSRVELFRGKSEFITRLMEKNALKFLLEKVEITEVKYMKKKR